MLDREHSIKSANASQVMLARFSYRFMMCYVLWKQFSLLCGGTLNEEDMCGVPAMFGLLPIICYSRLLSLR